MVLFSGKFCDNAEFLMWHSLVFSCIKYLFSLLLTANKKVPCIGTGDFLHFLSPSNGLFASWSCQLAVTQSFKRKHHHGHLTLPPCNAANLFQPMNNRSRVGGVSGGGKDNLYRIWKTSSASKILS